MATPDEDLLSEAIEDHRSIGAAIAGISDEINVAINSLAKDRLAAARSALAQAKTRSSEIVCPQKRESRWQVSIIQFEENRYDVAARKDQGASEKDILSAFTDLCELHECTHRVPNPEFGNLPKAEYILNDLGLQIRMR